MQYHPYNLVGRMNQPTDFAVYSRDVRKKRGRGVIGESILQLPLHSAVPTAGRWSHTRKNAFKIIDLRRQILSYVCM